MISTPLPEANLLGHFNSVLLKSKTKKGAYFQNKCLRNKNNFENHSYLFRAIFLIQKKSSFSGNTHGYAQTIFSTALDNLIAKRLAVELNELHTVFCYSGVLLRLKLWRQAGLESAPDADLLFPRDHYNEKIGIAEKLSENLFKAV